MCLPGNRSDGDVTVARQAGDNLVRANEAATRGDKIANNGFSSSKTNDVINLRNKDFAVAVANGNKSHCAAPKPISDRLLPGSRANDNGNDAKRINQPTSLQSVTSSGAAANETIIISAPPPPPPAPATDFGAIMLITILYYFQDAQLLHVKTAFAAPEPKEWALIKAILLGLFKFRLEIAHFVDSVCLLVGLGASVKLVVRTVMVPYVLSLFGVLYALHWLVCGRARDDDTEKRFQSRLAMGFMLALLFTYQMLATTAFSLLSCVPVGDVTVLFIDATVTCYMPWQYGVLTYAMTSIIPFSFVLMLGPGLLQEGRISVATFFAAGLFPFPFVVTWFAARAFKREHWLSVNAAFPTPPGKVVIKVLQGPFKDIRTRVTGPLCWAGVLIFRRLLLVLIYTFVNVALFRILSMLIVCYVILMNQVHVKPYQDARANLAGNISVAALLLVGGINLVRACFEAAEYTPHGPYESLIVVMQHAEDVLMLWIPLAFMVVVGCILVVKIIFYLVFRCRN